MRNTAVSIVALCLLTAGCAGGSTSTGSSGSGTKQGSPAAATLTQPSSASPPATVPSITSPGAAGPVLVLGQGRGVTEGYGSARPATISNGGDPTGIVTNVSWQSWGGPEAVGTGTGYYDPPNEPVSKAIKETATVVAFNRGTCAGQYMYQGIEWYFPESGGSFNTTSYLNICSWTYYPGPAPTG